MIDMKKKLAILFMLSYTFFNLQAYAADVTQNSIIKNMNQAYEPGCTDPSACNYNSSATEDSGDCTYECISPEVVCPEDTEIYLCVPNTTPPALELVDFIPSGNTSILDDLIFEPDQADGVNPDFTLTIYSYVIEDSRGNQRACIQRFYNTNNPIDPPEVTTEIDLCQDQLWSFIRKPFLENYRFYSDNRGEPGELLRICQFPFSVCSTANFSLDTSKPGSGKFWVTSFIRFTEEEICESEPVLIDVNVRAKPTASLVEKEITLQIGEYVNLREMVTGDNSGVWKGDEIISFSIPSGDTWYFFGSNNEGTRKLYYTVGNEFCRKTLILVVRVVSSGIAQKNSKVGGLDILKVYPNPSNGLVFVDAGLYSNEKLSITVTDIYGKISYQYESNKVSNGIINMDLNHLPKGVYLVEMHNESTHHIEKIILK